MNFRLKNGRLFLQFEVFGQRYFDSYVYAPELYGDNGPQDRETVDRFWVLMLENDLFWSETWANEGAMRVDLPGDAGARLGDMARHSLVLDMITRQGSALSPRYGVDPGYGLPAGANDGFQEVFTSSMTAAAEWGLKQYGQGVLVNWLDQFLRRGGALLGYRGLEMAQQGRELSVIAAFYRNCPVADARCDAKLVLGHLKDLQGAMGILRKRRAKGLRLPKAHPAHGLPFGNDEADLWHRTTERVGGQQTELPYLSIAAEMYRGFHDLGETLVVLGERYREPAAIAEGHSMQADAAALLTDLRTSLARTASIATAAGGPCPFAFVAGGSSCTVADGSQPTGLQPRENEPWRSYSELLYSSVLPLNMTLAYLEYAESNDKAMKLGVLSGSGSSAGGPQLQTFTIHGFGHGLLVADLTDRFLLLLYSVATHGCTRGTWVCAESTSIDRDKAAIKYATPSQLAVPVFLKWMLSFENHVDQSLTLAKAVPDDWFVAGFSAEAVPTRCGVLAYSIRPSSVVTAGAKQLVIAVNVTLPSSWVYPAGGLKVRVRAKGMVIESVSVADRLWKLSAADRVASVLTVKGQGAPALVSLQRIAVTLKSGE